MKVVLYMAMTVNGYIAKENDETPWSDAIWKSYYKITKNFKAIILGRHTYQIMKRVKEFDKIDNPFTLVVTTRPMKNKKNFAFIKTPAKAIKFLRSRGFSRVLVGGGSKLNASFIKAGLIDEIYLDVEPLAFGSGIKLFDDSNFETKLRLIRIRKLSKDVIQLHYKVK